MYILAIDPGLHVGLAVCCVESSKVQSIGIEQLDDGISSIATLLESGTFLRCKRIICESYTIRPDTFNANVGTTLETVKVIGAIELACKLHGCELLLQTAAQAKGAWPTARLQQAARRYGVTREVLNTPHKQDALRHLFYYLEKTFGTITTNPVVIK